MMRLVFGLVAALAASPLVAWDGAAAPEFAAARSAWLAGADDMAVLAALAPQAAGGNLAAQVMLGTLVAEGRLPAAVGALPDAGRMALTLAPGGALGNSWLTVAAREHPVAAALEVAGLHPEQASPAERAAALEQLLAAGETGAAQRLLGIVSDIGGWGPQEGWSLLAEYGAHPALQGHGMPLAMRVLDLVSRRDTDHYDPEGTQRLFPLLQGNSMADLALAELGVAAEAVISDPVNRSFAASMLPRSEMAAPLVGLCAAACPAGVGACTLAMAVAVEGRPGSLTLSPFEALVSSADYQASPRFRGDLRAGLQVHARAYLEALDGCAAAAVWD